MLLLPVLLAAWAPQPLHQSLLVEGEEEAAANNTAQAAAAAGDGGDDEPVQLEHVLTNVCRACTVRVLADRGCQGLSAGSICVCV